jgi:hypothetical protein
MSTPYTYYIVDTLKYNHFIYVRKNFVSEMALYLFFEKATKTFT